MGVVAVDSRQSRLKRLLPGALFWVAAAVLAAAAAYYWRGAYVWLSSEAILDRRYTLPRSLVKADSSPAAIARGARLVRLAGCTGCHGPDLAGRPMRKPIAIFASNLRALTPVYADEDFDRAIRKGLRPDASSLWVMPSQAYLYMHDSDVAAIVGYLRALRPKGRITPPPKFGKTARRKIADGELKPVADTALRQMPAADLGPHYDGGRYIAMTSCGVCHGTELTGSPDGRAPDLDVAARYTRAEFFRLMRKGCGAGARSAPKGCGPGGRELKIMGPLAKQRFHILKDWEINPLYDYLIARAKIPAAARTASGAQ